MDISQLTSATNSLNKSSSLIKNYNYIDNENIINNLEEKKNNQNNNEEEIVGLDEKIINDFDLIIPNNIGEKIKFTINKEILLQSGLLRVILENDKSLKEIEIQLHDKLLIKNKNIEFYVKKIIQYFYYYTNHKHYTIEKPIKYPTLKECGISEWDEKFLLTDENYNEMVRDMFNLLSLSNYLNISELIELVCSNISIILKNKNVEELECLVQQAWTL